MSQEQVYLKGFNKVESFILFPDQGQLEENNGQIIIIFNDDPWLSDSDTGSEYITAETNHATLHLKSIHSFNFLQETTEQEIHEEEPEKHTVSEEAASGGGE